MELNKLSLKDKPLLKKYLGLGKHHLSCFSFENIYIWSSLYDIRWKLIKGCLCIFFIDNIGCFLYLPPLGKALNSDVLDEVFRIMDSFNKNALVSRVENVAADELEYYKKYGFANSYKSCDYLCSNSELQGLRGNKFKAKRSLYNYFSKNYKFRYRGFRTADKKECLELYERWSGERKKKEEDRLYQGMLDDCGACLKVLLDSYNRLCLEARVVSVDEKIRAFTCGFKINKESFCVLYEFADLAYKGISQFIFRSFCRDLKKYKYINIMDDSGLDNLKQVKLSYRPHKSVPAFVVFRKHQE